MSTEPSERPIPPAAPTRKTLVFPHVDLPRSPRPSPFLRDEHPVPSARPSERPTVPTLPPVAAARAGTSNTEVVELSASALDTDSGLDVGSVTGFDESGGSVLDLDRLRAKRTTTRRRSALAYVGLGALGLVVGVLTLPGGWAVLTERLTGVSEGLHGPVRTPNAPDSQHTALAARTIAEIVAPAGGCAKAGAARVLSTRAHLAPGLDVNAASGGFGVGFAATADEALGVRLDGSRLRVADRVRVRSGTGSAVKHVAVDAGRDDDALDLRVDADDARTVVPDGEAPAFRIGVVGGWIQATTTRGAPGQVLRVKALWPAPGAAAPTRRSDGFVRLGAPRPRAVSVVPPDVRAAAREDGGAVVALRRASTLWLGIVDGHLTSEGPLIALTRPGAALGMPAVAPWGGGGAVAWAERPVGDREWIIVVASFASRADGAREAPTTRVIAPGMSPSIAMLPDGELLLAYAVGASGSHRVVVQRLGRDLEPRGEPIVVSPDALNAGQPAAAVGSDGRGLVAFFAAEHGRAASVLATPLTCDPGL